MNKKVEHNKVKKQKELHFCKGYGVDKCFNLTDSESGLCRVCEERHDEYVNAWLSGAFCCQGRGRGG